MMLDIARPFIDLEGKDSLGLLPLFMIPEYSTQDSSSSKLSLLLARGANLHARDDDGRTSLHKFIRKAVPNSAPGDLQSMVLLIRSGADVYSVDKRGRSVSESAYMYRRLDKFHFRGGLRGDLWDAALSQCGYDLHELRRGYHRRPRYTQKYTRKHFERLWSGREEFCPYFHDPPVWCPRSTLDSGECPLKGPQYYCEMDQPNDCRPRRSAESWDKSWDEDEESDKEESHDGQSSDEVGSGSSHEPLENEESKDGEFYDEERPPDESVSDSLSEYFDLTDD